MILPWELTWTSYLLAPLFVGINWFYLSLLDGETLRLNDLFRPFQYYFKIVGAFFMVTILTVLWSLLFVIPGIIKGFAYSQTFYILKDNPDLGIFEAITKSREMMKGNKAKLLLVNLSFIGWYLPMVLSFSWLLYESWGILPATIDSFYLAFSVNPFVAFLYLVSALGITFYVIPYYYLTLAAFYRQISKAKPAQSA